MPFSEIDLKIESLWRNGGPSRLSHGCHCSRGTGEVHTPCWVTSESVAQRPSPQRPDSRLASVRVSPSASAPDVVVSFVDKSSGSAQDMNEACLPLYLLYWRLAPTQGHQRTMCSTDALDGIGRNQLSAES